MSVFFGVLGTAVLTAFFMAARAAVAALLEIAGNLGDISARLESDSKTVRQELRDLEDLVDRLPARWDDVKREIARLDSRARYAAKSAREELARSEFPEPDALAAVADELGLGDAPSRGAEGVLSLHAGLAGGETPDNPYGAGGVEYARRRLRGA